MSSVRQLRYQAAKSQLRGSLVLLRHRGLDQRDIFVASYPRSGSTWLRFLLCETLTKRDAGLEDVNRYIPDDGGQANAVTVLLIGGRMIKSNVPYRPDY